MSGLCSAEISMVEGDIGLNSENEYKRLSTMSESIIEILYQELNLVEG
jgi:hypothetical protein